MAKVRSTFHPEAVIVRCELCGCWRHVTRCWTCQVLDDEQERAA